ncbi:uncharacterized protein ALTATR162_LOCUS48 [Alternaria atra]|uniref:Zn(2)-C6 fungal-type domain-containing protein n=1 Tax=Alternaria atra TaxID=119953 RepID=A0A8J2HUT5_9PLEO|nr:uncharacterized protein ALTATR162_LOCUS48 [Alternaria atra]CAG5137182.1 unnamed protein product [Alternaria atra]
MADAEFQNAAPWKEPSTIPTKYLTRRYSATPKVLNKACTRCRKHKTKCSGTRPRCIGSLERGVTEEPDLDHVIERY